MVSFGEGECMVRFNDTFVGLGGNGNVRLFQVYNLTTNTWTNPISLNNGAYFSSCLLLPNTNGKLLVLAVDSCCSTGTQTATVIDLVTLQQTPVSIPTLLRGFGVNLVTLGKRVFAINGWNWSSNIGIVEEYHSINNSWAKIATPVIQTRHRGRAINVPASWFSKLPNGCRGAM